MGIVLAGVVFFVKSQKNKPITKAPDQSTTTQLPEAKLEISGVVVNNFLKSEIEKNEQGDSLLVDNSDYQIVYFPKTKEFIVSITDSPFNEIKQRAEKDLVSRLGVEKEEACKFNVVITTPRFANPEEAGKVYKLSFCE